MSAADGSGSGQENRSESGRRRALSVPELWKVMMHFSTAAGVARGLAFEPRRSDVFIATYPKCGTTLMQQIVHGIRTGGDMDFRKISEVIPWIELAADLDLDADEERIRIATQQASIDFMRRYPTLWEDVLMREKRNAAMGIPADAGSSKLRSGDLSPARGVLTEAVGAAWRTRWAEVVEPVTGCADYAELRRAVALEGA